MVPAGEARPDRRRIRRMGLGGRPMSRKKPRCEGDIDPTQTDALAKPKRRRKIRTRKPAPAFLGPYIEEAEARQKARRPTPGVMMEPNDQGGYMITSPHDDLGG